MAMHEGLPKDARGERQSVWCVHDGGEWRWVWGIARVAAAAFLRLQLVDADDDGYNARRRNGEKVRIVSGREKLTEVKPGTIFVLLDEDGKALEMRETTGVVWTRDPRNLDDSHLRELRKYADAEGLLLDREPSKLGLVEGGFIIETDAGYKLTEAGRAAAKLICPRCELRKPDVDRRSVRTSTGDFAQRKLCKGCAIDEG